MMIVQSHRHPPTTVLIGWLRPDLVVGAHHLLGQVSHCVLEEQQPPRNLVQELVKVHDWPWVWIEQQSRSVLEPQVLP